VRAGFRAEFVDTILGANAHVTVYSAPYIVDDTGRTSRALTDFAEMAERIEAIPGVTRAAPLIKGQVMANLRAANTGVEVFGITLEDLQGIPRVAGSEDARGDIARFGEGVAIGSGVARELGVQVGDRIRLISPNGCAPPSAPARGSMPTRSSTSSPPAATTSTAPGSTCPSPRRSPSSTGGRRRRDRGHGRHDPNVSTTTRST
jgi:ABC-type lipoprotein release transport system permease subunit